MDIYSSKVPKNEEYDTVLISLVCLLISTKYLQIKYPGADALNYQVNNRYKDSKQKKYRISHVSMNNKYTGSNIDKAEI